MNTASHPPELLRLLAHDLRWGILQALSASDLRVQEIVDRLAQPQNLISYHLHCLLRQGVVRERRSLADGRAVYYSLDLDRLNAMVQESGAALHPALGRRSLELPAFKLSRPVRVLFLCTHNSARSQMAEGLLRARGRGQVQAFSAGVEPSGIHPLAVSALHELGIDIRSQRSKSVSGFLGAEFDYVITVCDRAREACPSFLGQPVMIHWSIPDPAAAVGSADQVSALFRSTAAELDTRIGYLLHRIQSDQSLKESKPSSTGE